MKKYIVNTNGVTKQRGFTLIELLVVIAIIGVLSAVILASLNSARTRGNDAAIKSNLSTIHVQAEAYYTQNGHYGSQGVATDPGCDRQMFTNDNTIKNAISAITAIVGTDTAKFKCGSNGTPATSYAVEAKLSDGTYWCIDSTGVVGSRVTAPTIGMYVCPAT